MPAPPCFPAPRLHLAPLTPAWPCLGSFRKGLPRILVEDPNSRPRLSTSQLSFLMHVSFRMYTGTALYEVIHPWHFPVRRLGWKRRRCTHIPCLRRAGAVGSHSVGPWRAAILALTQAVRSAASANFRHRWCTCMSPRLKKPRIRLRPAQCTLPMQLPAIGGVDTSWP